MSTLSNYIFPVTTWLHAHPNLALLFTFIIAFTESLAIIGTIIPGSLTMTMIGILAGSNVMRFDLTLVFSTLGACAGDGVSFILGYVYRSRLKHIWPFKRYPALLNYGQDFFTRHGRKSVLIGRFIGPLRSIIPLIAGMMSMPRLHFFIANVISGVGWSILYLFPGYIIGAASSQLSSESAQRLFIFVLIVLVTLWLITQLLHAFTKHLNQTFTHVVNTVWLLSKSNPYTRFLLNILTNSTEKKQQKVIRLLLIWLLNALLTLILIIVVNQDSWINHVNTIVCLFLNTLRTPIIDKTLIVFTFILHPLSLMVFSLFIGLLNFFQRNWRFLRYWISLNLSTALVIHYCGGHLSSTTIIPLYTMLAIIGVFPEPYLCTATALFTFSIYYLAKNHKPLGRFLAHSILLLLSFCGFANLYFGDNWLTSVLGSYSLGFSLGLLHWILYNRKHTNPHHIWQILLITLGLFTLTTSIVYYEDFEIILEQHTPKTREYILNLDTWWYQDEPILPLYTTNRLGKRSGIFNVQYAGSIQELEKRLRIYGWKKQSRSFLYSLIIHAEGRDVMNALPFLSQLYLNNPPAITLSYQNKNNDLYIFRLWRSNYRLMHYSEPIWLGNVVLSHSKSRETADDFQNKHASKGSELFIHILPAVYDYQITRIPATDPHLKSLPYEIPDELLIIKN